MVNPENLRVLLSLTAYSYVLLSCCTSLEGRKFKRVVTTVVLTSNAKFKAGTPGWMDGISILHGMNSCEDNYDKMSICTYLLSPEDPCSLFLKFQNCYPAMCVSPDNDRM